MCAGVLTQEKLAHQSATRAVDKPIQGLIQRNQIPQKNQHVFPAAMPLWRSLLSVLAAILVGLALRNPKNYDYFLNDAASPGLTAARCLYFSRFTVPGVPLGANITHLLNPSSY
jgi:hypothetical protein